MRKPATRKAIKLKPITTSVDRLLPEGYTRHSLVIKKKHLAQIKWVIYWKRILMRDALTDILENYLKSQPDKIKRGPDNG